MDFRLFVPNNWQDFESICHKLWSEIWNDHNTQKNGRQGQSQNGVDIYGQPIYSNKFSGVQCKDKDSRLGSFLKEDELIKECQKAKNFNPSIKEFTIATTSSRDEQIQSVARNLTEGKELPFNVQIWSWNDIESEIIYRPTILNHYYPSIKDSFENQNVIKLNRYTNKSNLFAYFSRPLFEKRELELFKDYFIPLVYEFSDNAYTHGKASTFEVSFNNNKFLLKDNGKKFNPLLDLDLKSVSGQGNIGSYVFELFRNKFTEMTIDYKCIQVNVEEFNVLEIPIPSNLEDFSRSDFFELNVDIIQVSGRLSAQKLARSFIINSTTKEIIINVGSVYNVSAFVEFILEMLRILTENQELRIYIPRNPVLADINNWIKDERLSIVVR
ncbi:MAG: hypothetical protein KKA84_16265 [Bacteroidetes bacterium]|nr:hypothetical protein [Bacteroidota bacterium]